MKVRNDKLFWAKFKSFYGLNWLKVKFWQILDISTALNTQ